MWSSMMAPHQGLLSWHCSRPWCQFCSIGLGTTSNLVHWLMVDSSAQTSFPSSLKCEVVFTVSNSGGRPPSLTGKLISQHSGISGFISLRVGQSPPANVRRANAILSSTLPQLLLLQLRTGRYMAPSCPRRPSGSPDDDDKAETF